MRSGGIDEVVAQYVESGTQEHEADLRFAERPDAAGTIRRIALVNAQGKKTTESYNDERLTLEIEYELREALPESHVYVLLDRADGLLVLRSADDDHRPLSASTTSPRPAGQYTRQIHFPPGVLNEGIYQFRVVLTQKRSVELDEQRSAFFRVEDRTDYRNASLGKRKGVLLFPLEWSERRWSADEGHVDVAPRHVAHGLRAP